MTVTFYNSINEIVKELEYKDIGEGFHEIYWDGKDEKGDISESDVYTFVISARSGERVFTYNPAVNTGNKDLVVEKQAID